MRSEAVNTQDGASGDTAPLSSKDVAVSCVADATGAELPASSMEVALSTHAVSSISSVDDQALKPRSHQGDVARSATQKQIEQRRERHWRRLVHSELRDRLIATMMEQLQRVTGDPDVRHLRLCASRYESFVWKKSANQVQYKQKLEHRIASLCRQPSHGENGGMDVTVRLAEGHRLNLIRSSHPTLGSCPYSRPHVSEPNPDITGYPVAGALRPRQSGCRSSTVSDSQGAGNTIVEQHDLVYFAKLRGMKNQYRDEVALVFRELCRVNTVIQHSSSLRRQESNNLGDFLANLKKIIYLLEQQPNEACGMIPARKRTVEYLDIVELHIQRKVLPILYRLRHTYSTILRPIVLNYMKNTFRLNRRF